MRERQVRHYVTGGAFNAKYSPGGLADIEYLVQGLQITHGRENPSLKNYNTRRAMSALEKAGILARNDYRRLHKAHTFFRWLIDSLRVVRGNTRDVTVPLPDTQEAAFLARRMLYGSDQGKFHKELASYSKAVLEINQRLFSS
jgi:glutamate-ammonia-ligase adenylyltransferase